MCEGNYWGFVRAIIGGEPLFHGQGKERGPTVDEGHRGVGMGGDGSYMGIKCHIEAWERGGVERHRMP